MIESAKLARDYWPDIPGEVGAGAPIDRVVWIPYRCNDGPVFNFYHGAYYGGHPPAVFSATLIGPTIDTRPIASFRERISAPQGSVVRIVPAVKAAAIRQSQKGRCQPRFFTPRPDLPAAIAICHIFFKGTPHAKIKAMSIQH
jgi:hypothetical protein